MSSCAEHKECNSKGEPLVFRIIVEVLSDFIFLPLIKTEEQLLKEMIILAVNVCQGVPIEILCEGKNLGFLEFTLKVFDSCLS